MADDERPFLATNDQHVSVNSLIDQLDNDDEVFDAAPQPNLGTF